MNEVIDFPKFKNPKGKIKIELFDDLTGKKIEEVHSTNFIAKNITDTYFKMAMASLFTKDKKKGGVNLNNYLGDPFHIMSLTTDSSLEIPEKEWYRKGDLIGYAYSDREYVGSDKFLGTYNINESYTSIEKIHMVFDFPTHAANGTFSSIYFTKSTQLYDAYFLNKPFSADIKNVISAKKYNNEVWVLHDDKYENDGKTLNKYDSNFNLLQTYSLTNWMYDFEIYNDYIYFITNDSTNSIKKAPISNPTNLSTVLVSVPKIGTNTTYAGGIVFDVKKNQFVVSSSISDSSASSILRYDANLNLLAKNDYTHPEAKYTYQKLLYTDLGDIFVNGWDTSFVLENEKTANTGTGTRPVVGMIDDKVVYKNGVVAPKDGISSRSLLDAPVTKTETNTMKITYDFILPPIL